MARWLVPQWSEFVELDVKPPGLEKAVLDRTDIGDLRSQMKVEQLQTIELAPLLRLNMFHDVFNVGFRGHIQIEDTELLAIFIHLGREYI